MVSKNNKCTGVKMATVQFKTNQKSLKKIMKKKKSSAVEIPGIAIFKGQKTVK